MLMLMSAVETGQMSAVETRHLSLFPIYRYPPQRLPRHLGLQTWAPPPDLLHRRSDSEPEAMLGAYVGPCWLIFGHLGAMLAPSWLQLGPILALSWAILAPTWPSWPDFGSLLGHLRLPSGVLKSLKTEGERRIFKLGACVSPCWCILGILGPCWLHLGSNLAQS